MRRFQLLISHRKKMLTLYLCDLLVLCGATGACDWLQHSSGVYLSVRQNVQCNRTPRVCAEPLAQRALEVASACVWASARSIVCAKVSLCMLQCVCGWGASTVHGWGGEFSEERRGSQLGCQHIHTHNSQLSELAWVHNHHVYHHHRLRHHRFGAAPAARRGRPGSE
jgi:hypothetical protein